MMKFRSLIINQFFTIEYLLCFLFYRDLSLGMTDGTSLGWHGPTAIDLGSAKAQYEETIKNLSTQCSIMTEKILRLEAEVAIQNSLTKRSIDAVKRREMSVNQRLTTKNAGGVDKKSLSPSFNERIEEVDGILVC